MEPEVNGELAKLMVSLIGRRASKLLAWFCVIVFVAWAIPFAISQSERIGLDVNQLAAGTGGLPSIVDMAIVMCFMLGTWAIGVLITGFLWGLTDRVTGHLYYRREIQDMKTEIAGIKAHLGMEDVAECHDPDYTGRENAEETSTTAVDS